MSSSWKVFRIRFAKILNYTHFKCFRVLLSVPFVHKLLFVFEEVGYLRRVLCCTVYTAISPKELNFQAAITGKEE